MDTLHARIKSIRLDRGLSQSDLAARTGVSQPTVTNWENGSHVPRRQALIKISKILGVEAVWLLSGENTLAGSPAQKYLDLPIRHIPIYEWPEHPNSFASQKPVTYYPIAVQQDGLFGLISDGAFKPKNALLIFDSNIETRKPEDLYLLEQSDRLTLAATQSVSDDDAPHARLHMTIITH